MKRLMLYIVYLILCVGLGKSMLYASFPERFLDYSDDIYEDNKKDIGHLFRYVQIIRRKNSFFITSWDLVRLPDIKKTDFPVPIIGDTDVFIFSGKDNPVQKLHKQKQLEFRNERVIKVRCNRFSRNRLLVIKRKYVRKKNRDGLFKVASQGDTLRSVAVLKGFRSVPLVILPKIYTYKISKKENVINVDIVRRSKKKVQFCGYLLFHRGKYFLQQLRKQFFSTIKVAARGGSSNGNSVAKKFLEMKLRFQRICREAKSFAPGFFIRNGGRPEIIQAILQEAHDLGLRADVVFPLLEAKNRQHPLPRPGVRISYQRKNLWLFPDNWFSTPGVIPDAFRNRKAVLLNRRGSQRILIPGDSRKNDCVNLWSSIKSYRTGNGSLYCSYRLTGNTAAFARSLIGLAPAMDQGVKALKVLFLPKTFLHLRWLRIKHRIPTHLPLQGKARGWISGIFNSRRTISVRSLSLIGRRFGSITKAWQRESIGFPLFHKINAFRETVVLTLPRGVFARRVPRSILLKKSMLYYKAKWTYKPGRRYRKPRRWSWRRWRRWKRRHYHRRRSRLILSRYFYLKRKPITKRQKNYFVRILQKVDRWDLQKVRFRWR